MNRWIASVLGIGLTASAASACINDREVNRHEREFKSQYNDQPAPKPAEPTQPPSEGANPIIAGAGIVGGSALLVAGVALSLGVIGRKRDVV